MRFARADVLTYRGTAKGARGAATTWTERQGLLLRLTGTDGSIGQGEASPLPSYSPDTFDEARTALHEIDWNRVPEYESGEAVLEWLGRVAEATPVVRGAARFAVETALLDLLGQRLGRPLWTLLRDPAAPPGVKSLPLCAFVGGADDASVVERASRAAARGVHTVKLKITGPSLSSQLITLDAVRASMGRRTALRLDANRTLAPETAAEELASIAPLDPELVEEPIPTAALCLRGASSRFAVPIALDESLQDRDAWATLEPRVAELGCVAVVLKPMALGGVRVCLDLAARATARGLDVTVSHLFDGPVGLAAAAHLALAVASRTRASGLDRHGGLEAWPAVDVPHVTSTGVTVGELEGLGIARVPDPHSPSVASARPVEK